jgi:hypothetical protein
MIQRNIVRLVRAWIVVAAVAIPLRLHVGDARASVNTVAMARMVMALSLNSDSISHLVEETTAANLFGANDSDAGVAAPSMPAMPPFAASAGAPFQRMRLSAIIGPPWRAVVETDGAQAVPVVVEAGDSLLTFRILRISADTVVLKKGKTISHRAIAESWLP